MKTVKYIYTKSIVLLGMACILLVNCERDLPDEIVFSEFPSTPEIFIDGPASVLMAILTLRKINRGREPLLMALLTVHTLMLAFQREIGNGMIKKVHFL